MRLTQLDVVNQCLASMGETPLNTLDADHPYVSAALLTMKTTSTQEQAKGWWFNTDLATLHPDALSHFIYVPDEAININPNDDGTAYVLRGTRLYDRFLSTYKFAGAVRVEMVIEIPFEDLPMLAGNVVAARTVLDFQSAYDADGDKYQRLAVVYQQAYHTLRAEHIRQVKSNMLNNPSVQLQMRDIRPMTRFRHRRW